MTRYLKLVILTSSDSVWFRLAFSVLFIVFLDSAFSLWKSLLEKKDFFLQLTYAFLSTSARSFDCMSFSGLWRLTVFGILEKRCIEGEPHNCSDSHNSRFFRNYGSLKNSRAVDTRLLSKNSRGETAHRTPAKFYVSAPSTPVGGPGRPSRPTLQIPTAPIPT